VPNAQQAFSEGREARASRLRACSTEFETVRSFPSNPPINYHGVKRKYDISLLVNQSHECVALAED
jgi:hypothetical protein